MDKIKLNRFYQFSYHGLSYLTFVFDSTYVTYIAYFFTLMPNVPSGSFQGSVGKSVLDLNSTEVSYYNGMKALNDHYFSMSEFKMDAFKKYIDAIQKRYYNSIKYGRH